MVGTLRFARPTISSFILLEDRGEYTEPVGSTSQQSECTIWLLQRPDTAYAAADVSEAIGTSNA
jgi:hypothetical protein